MKKKIIIPVMLILLLALCAGLYTYHAHFAIWQLVEVDMTEAEILEEMPDIEITSEDNLLRELVLSLYKEQDAKEQLDARLESEWIVSELLVYEDVIVLTLYEDASKQIAYSFSVDGSFTIQKTVSIYEKIGEDFTEWKCLGVYENGPEGIRKYVNKRKWFSM